MTNRIFRAFLTYSQKIQIDVTYTSICNICNVHLTGFVRQIGAVSILWTKKAESIE